MKTSIIRRRDGLHELHLSGSSANPYWIAALFSGLSELGVSVVSASGAHDPRNGWNARMALGFGGSRWQPEQVDYAALVNRQVYTAGLPLPRLSGFLLARRADHGLEARLAAPDQAGFLCRLLPRISSLALYPVELETGTAGGRIRDRLVFRGIGGLAPGDTAFASLQSLLGRMTTRTVAPAAAKPAGTLRSDAATP